MKNLEMLSKVMKRAWQIKREDSRNIFSLCLRMAWMEVKNMASNVIENLKKFVSSNVEITEETEDTEEVMKRKRLAIKVNINKEIKYSVYKTYCDEFSIEKGNYNAETKCIEIKSITVYIKGAHSKNFEEKVAENGERMIKNAFIWHKKFLEEINVPYLA